jgi:hypothetical protein
MLGMLYYGDTKDITAAASYFQQRDPDIKEIYRWNNVIKVVREEKDPKDGSIIRTTTESIPLRDKNGVALSQEEFLQAASPRLAGIDDINTGLDQGSYIKGKPISTASPKEGISIKRTSSDDKSKTPTATKAEWKKAGWTDAQINEAVKAGKIKVI